MARVRTAARLHLGFRNCSLDGERLYGGCGVGIAAPRLDLTATRAGSVAAPDEASPYVDRAVEVLDVPGADVDLTASIPRHAGLGSGTQLALAAYAAIAAAYDRPIRPRAAAPALGRGGRSGVGVARFGGGGFVVDRGHPVDRFTPDPPAEGEWTVPPVDSRLAIPENWRFVLVRPDLPAGPSGAPEERAIRDVIRDADPAIADRAAAAIRDARAAVRDGNPAAFGRAATAIDRCTGEWFAGAASEARHERVDAIRSALRDRTAIHGAGQSSWGPTVYGVTTADRGDAARAAGEAALDAAGVAGTVQVVAGSNAGARIESD
jgi:beta-ribofuranosylaminobenzene 5'-phosphate synthase